MCMKAETLGAEYEYQEIPDEYKEKAEEYRSKMVESAVEQDDELMEKYLSGEDVTEEEIISCIRKGVINQAFVPVICGSAFKNKGVQLLDSIVNFLPSPLDVDDVEGTDVDNEEKIIKCKASENENLAMLAFKIMTDPFVGSLTFTRIYSGVLRSGDTVINSVKGQKERIGRMLLMHANSREDVKEAKAGDIVAIAGS